jgi:hypothetical protein
MAAGDPGREKVTGTFCRNGPSTNLRSVPGFAQKVPVTFSRQYEANTYKENL